MPESKRATIANVPRRACTSTWIAIASMVLHPQPEQPMAFAGVEQPAPLAALPQTGSLQREWRRCGKQRCRCARGILHGPYWYLRWRDRGRQRRRYVPRERIDSLQAVIEQRR